MSLQSCITLTSLEGFSDYVVYSLFVVVPIVCVLVGSLFCGVVLVPFLV